MAGLLEQSQKEFLIFLKTQGKASATLLAYGNDITQFAFFLSQLNITRLDQITSDHIEQYKLELLNRNYTSKSVARKLNSIKTYFKYLQQSNIIQNNPGTGVKQPQYILNAPRILTKMEYRALRDVSRHDVRMYAIIELFLQTGIRIGELSNLTLEDIVDNKLTIRPYESRDTRTIPLNKPATDALNRWLEARPNVESNALFLTRNGKFFQVRNIRTAIDRYFKMAEIHNATVNDLRHTFIAHQLKAGTTLTVVCRLAGHKRISTTEKYLEFIKDTDKNSSEEIKEL